jgi:hypothetical protein
MGLKDTKVRIQEALNILTKNDPFLLKYNVNERSITHKLAEYLQQLFPGYHVDCEYNRMLKPNESKTFISKALLNLKDDKRVSIKSLNAKTVSPDIIVHSRGNNQNNLLVIEFKKGNRNSDFDKKKLKEYKRFLHYKYAVFIKLVQMHFTLEWL